MIEICTTDNCDRETPTGHEICRRCAAIARGQQAPHTAGRVAVSQVSQQPSVGDYTKENPHGEVPTCRECGGPWWYVDRDNGRRYGPYDHYRFCSHAGTVGEWVLAEHHRFDTNWIIRPDEPEATIEGSTWAALKALLGS